MSGYIIAHVNRDDFVECREREGDYNMNSARSYATVFPTQEAAEAYAQTHVRSLTVIEPVGTCGKPIIAPLGSVVGHCGRHENHDSACSIGGVTEQAMLARLNGESSSSDTGVSR